MPSPGERKKDGFVAKAAGVAVVSGIAWSILKSFTLSASSSSSSAPALSAVDVAARKNTYSVSQGDTLFSISQRFGVPIDDLKAANKVHGDEIFAGDQLFIPK